MEDLSGEGEYQGGNVDIVTLQDDPAWGGAGKGIPYTGECQNIHGNTQ